MYQKLATLAPLLAAALLAAIALSGCSHAPGASAAPLPPDLAAIQCPADRSGHGNGMFNGKAQVTFVCARPEAVVDPKLFRCDPDSRPMVCEDVGSIILSRTADGVVHEGPQSHPSPDPTDPGVGPTDDSELFLNFHAGPPRTPTFDVAETQWRFQLRGAQDLLPPGFTFVKGTMCDRAATVLDTGTCNMEATTPSMYWHIAVSLRHRKDTPITDAEYRKELAFWMKYVGLLIVDPKP